MYQAKGEDIAALLSSVSNTPAVENFPIDSEKVDSALVLAEGTQQPVPVSLDLPLSATDQFGQTQDYYFIVVFPDRHYVLFANYLEMQKTLLQEGEV